MQGESCTQLTTATHSRRSGADQAPGATFSFSIPCGHIGVLAPRNEHQNHEGTRDPLGRSTDPSELSAIRKLWQGPGKRGNRTRVRLRDKSGPRAFQGAISLVIGTAAPAKQLNHFFGM